MVETQGMTDGGELLIRALERAGIGMLFTLHGGHLDAIFQAARRHGLRLIYGHENRVVTDLASTRYDQAAAGFGCHAEHVTEIAGIGPAIGRALASGLPACINVMTDPSVISPVTMALVGSLAGASPSAGNGDRVTMPDYDDRVI